GGRNSVGEMNVGQMTTKVSIPKKMDGPEVGTNPSDMLLGAAGGCYLMTLAAMIERAELPLQEIGLKSEGIVDIINGVITYKKVSQRPTVILTDEATEQERNKLQRISVQADRHGIVSRAVEGNITIELETYIR